MWILAGVHFKYLNYSSTPFGVRASVHFIYLFNHARVRAQNTTVKYLNSDVSRFFMYPHDEPLFEDVPRAYFGCAEFRPTRTTTTQVKSVTSIQAIIVTSTQQEHRNMFHPRLTFFLCLSSLVYVARGAKYSLEPLEPKGGSRELNLVLCNAEQTLQNINALSDPPDGPHQPPATLIMTDEQYDSAVEFIHYL